MVLTADFTIEITDDFDTRSWVSARIGERHFSGSRSLISMWIKLVDPFVMTDFAMPSRRAPSANAGLRL